MKPRTPPPPPADSERTRLELDILASELHVEPLASAPAEPPAEKPPEAAAPAS